MQLRRSIRFFRKFAAGVCLLAFFSQARADSLSDWSQNVRELKLANGMTFLLYPRGEVPIFSAYIRFKAGGVDEESGKTGIAHFLEHMAFKGTKTIGTRDWKREKLTLDKIRKVGEAISKEYAKKEKANRDKIRVLRDELRKLHEEEKKYIVTEELSKRISENGGNDLNATTSKDMTSYFVSFPSEKLRFWAELESERIFQPVFREFYEEKDVVLEERRMRVDDDPDGRLYEAFLQAAFQKSPYRWPTIGLTEDLLSLTVEDLEGFWKKQYHPSWAVGTLVGKFDAQEAETILKETFGKIEFPEGPLPPENFPQEPPQTEERRVVLSEKARPRLLIGYHKPTLPEPDDYVFDLLNQIVGEGRSSRLYRTLVLEKKLAANVETATAIPGSRLPNLFMIEVSPLAAGTEETILRLIDAEFDKIKKEGVTPEELEKAKNRLKVDMVWQLKTNDGLASTLSYYQIVDTWRYIADYLEKVDRFQAADVRRVVETYLKPANRTVAILKSL